MDYLDDDYFKTKYSQANTNNNYIITDGKCLSFYDLLYKVHQYTASSDYPKLVNLAENIQKVQFNINLDDGSYISIATSKCYFYLNFCQTIFELQKRLISINSECAQYA